MCNKEITRKEKRITSMEFFNKRSSSGSQGETGAKAPIFKYPLCFYCVSLFKERLFLFLFLCESETTTFNQETNWGLRGKEKKESKKPKI